MKKHRQNWLDIFSGFRVALDARKIVLGTLGAYISIMVLLGLLSLAPRWWPGSQGLATHLIQSPCEALADIADKVPTSLCGTCCDLFNPKTSCVALSRLAFLAGGGLILLFVWSYFGGAITRIAAVDFAKDERPQLSEATSFAANKFGSFFWSPIVPLIFVLLFVLCNVVLGVIGRIPAAGPVIMGIFFALAALSSFLIVLLLIGTICGSMFMWPTISMEGTDAFDAISRGFNYLFARPWKTLWCCLVAGAYGAVVTAFVAAFTGLLLTIAVNTVALGMGQKFDAIGHFVSAGFASPTAGVSAVIAMILLKVVIVTGTGLVLGFCASYKFTAITIIYSVLRRDVDGTDMSEVFLPEAEETPAEPPAEKKPDATAGEQKPAE